MRMTTMIGSCFFFSCVAAMSLAANVGEPQFHAFTARVKGDKVRLRLQPSLDAPIVKEVRGGELLLALGQTEEFYAVQPPPDVKGYVYRAFVLDNIVEGSHVNVRLAPSLDSPVIMQLNSGDTVEGRIAASNNKWLEIELPHSARLFVSGDYLESIGDAHLLASRIKKAEELSLLFDKAQQMAREQLNRSFGEIHVDSVVDAYTAIIKGYVEFPDRTAAAEKELKEFQENYLEKKLNHLEEQAFKVPSKKQELIKEESKPLLSPKMACWLPIEEERYLSWCRQHGDCSWDEWLALEKEESFALKGTVQPYQRNLKYKPGDYLLVNSQGQTIAYLYSATISLEDYVGSEVILSGVLRPNHQFAFPAYCILSVH